MTPKTQKNRAGADERLLDEARATVGRGLANLQKCIERVEKGLASKKYDPKLASHLAYLTEHVTAVLRELRQVENHEAKQVNALSLDEAYRALMEAGWKPPKGTLQ